MIKLSLIGNPFNIRENPFKNKKAILYYIGSIFLFSVLSFLLIKQPIAPDSIVLSSLVSFLVGSLIYSVINIKIIFFSFKEYLKLDFKRMVLLIIQIIISVTIYIIWSGGIKSNFWMAIGGGYFWFISGLIRIINERSEMLIKEGYEHIVIMLKLYAINRLSFFFIALIGFISSETFATEIFILSSNWWLFIMLLSSTIYFYFITTNLLPYILKSNRVKNCLRIIKEVSVEKQSKEKLREELKITEKEVNYLIDNLEYTKFIEKEDRKYTLGGYRIFI